MPLKPVIAVQSAALPPKAPTVAAAALPAPVAKPAAPALQLVASAEPAAPVPVMLPAARPVTQADDSVAVQTPVQAKAAAPATPHSASAPVDRATAYALAAFHKAEGPVRTAGREIGNFIVAPAQASEGNQATQPVGLQVGPQPLGLRPTANEPALAQSGHGWRLGDPLIPEGSWVIQIGAYADQADAVDRIRSAIKAAPELGKAVPVTVPVKTADNRTLYRSRFGGFDDEKEARNACGRLARESISCVAIPPANWSMPASAAAKEKARS